MGRPRAVIFSKFAEYNLLHTKLSKMYSGVSTTILYPIKETAEFYRSIEVWASCASSFKMKKKNGNLEYKIPVLTDEKAIAFLDAECWADWVDEETRSGRTDMIETIALLNNLFPDKEKKYFYELESMIHAYQWGSFEKFEDDGTPKPPSDNDIKQQKYYCHKYSKFLHDVPHLKALYDAYHAAKDGDEAKKKELFSIYHTAEKEYVFENRNIVNEMIQIGRNSVCYPVAFSHGTADWHMEKYGKPCEYAHAGEIHFVVTPNCVYFSIARHF